MIFRRPREPIAYGIDFGTTNSAVSIAHPDRVEVVRVGPQEVLPSIVYLHRNGNRAAGEDAVAQFMVTGSHKTLCGRCELVRYDSAGASSECRQYRRGGRCQDARLISGLKSELSEINYFGTHSWAIDFTLPDMVAVVMRRLKTIADRASGADVRRAVLGHPVAFAGAEGKDFKERQATAEKRLQQAAELAGFEEIALFEEPAAALMDESLTEGIGVAVDFGGGTFDVAVIKFAPDGGDIIALAGVDVGGEDFDRLLFQAKVAPALHLGDSYETRPGVLRSLPAMMQNRLSTLAGFKLLLSDPNTASTLSEFRSARGGEKLATVEAILYGGYAYRFYGAIEAAKIGLSAGARASIEFHQPGVDLSVPVSRREFEALIAEPIRSVRAEILTALKNAGIGPKDVSLVLRTGGSSSIPAFIQMLEEIFDPAIVQERPVYTTVVYGLAKKAQEVWA
jgi:hypothetical chaperone protein